VHDEELYVIDVDNTAAGVEGATAYPFHALHVGMESTIVISKKDTSIYH
jgi:hypothetical protein